MNGWMNDIFDLVSAQGTCIIEKDNAQRSIFAQREQGKYSPTQKM